MSQKDQAFGCGFRVHQGIPVQTIPGAGIVIKYNIKTAGGGYYGFDRLNEFNTALYQFQPIRRGIYFINYVVSVQYVALGNVLIRTYLRLNGVAVAYSEAREHGLAEIFNINGQAFIWMNPGDVIDVFAETVGGNRTTAPGSSFTYIEGFRVA